MAERIASGEIHIGVDDDAAIAALRRVESDFARTMQKIDRQSAEVDLSADYDHLKRDLKRAQAEYNKYKKYVDDADSEYTRKARRRKLQEAEADLKAAKAAEKAHRIRMQQHSAEGKAEADAERRRVAIEKRADQRERVFEQASRRRLRAINQESRVRASLDRQREREMSRAHSAALLEERDRQNSITAMERQERQIRKLQRQYSEAADKAEKFNREARKIATLAAPGVRQRIDIAQREALAEMALLQAELKVMGARPIEQQVDLHMDEKGVNTLNRWIKAITETTVRVGPLTTTIAGLSRALLLLGPIMSGLVGQFAALAAGVGAGLGGALGVATGALGAFGVSLGGIAFLLPSLLRDFKKLNQFQDAYRTAVLKYGRASSQAKDKLDQFNNALGTVSPTTRRAFMSMDELSDRWRRLSREARPTFFNILGQGILTVNKHFEFFRRNTLGAFDQLSAGWTEWMEGLRSDEAGRILRTLGRNGNASIRPLMQALGNLGTLFGRIAEAFSNYLPDLIRGFRDWSGALADSAGDVDAMDKKAGKLVESMRAVGRLLMATYRFITAFFSPGVDDGTQMINNWADGLNNAAEKMRTTGRSGLNDWFRDSIELANQFWRALKPLAELFFEWTTIMAPFTSVALNMAAAIGEIVEALLSFGPTKLALQTAFAIFLTGAVLKRVTSMGSGLWSIAKAVGAIKAAGGLGNMFKGGVLRFATGGLRGQTPANPMYVMNVGPGGGGGIPGRGAPAGGGIGTVGRLALRAGGVTAVVGGVVSLTAALDKLGRSRELEKFDKRLSDMVRKRDITGLQRLKREIDEFGGGQAADRIRRVEAAMDAAATGIDGDARRISNSVKTSWDRVQKETNVTFKRVKDLATFNFRVIEDNVGKSSYAAQAAASKNFWKARRNIKSAIDAGTIDTKRGLALIEKLWLKTLSFYGFSPKQARNIQQGQTPSGGREDGTSGIGKARGGLMDIGRKGVAARDNVPAMLNGQPALVAEGEQVAVFNRHQQRAMDGVIPGGLEGFFGRNRRPHYAARGGIVDRYAGGGIVPVPGFPGESAASSVLDEIAWVAKKFGLILTDAFGPGHSSPGHTIHGTAADFSGPDAAMGAAVKALVRAGYLVGYDGSHGSESWPGHGPAAGQGGSNAHLHVEFGSKGGKLSMAAIVKQIARVTMQDGLGLMSTVGQRTLDSVRGAANANLEGVAAASMAVPTAGGHGGAAAPKGQIRAWIVAGLKLAGYPVSGAAINTLYGRIMQESGGRPDIVNNWDSNAAAGTPSKGILQTIDPTFDAYKVRGHNNIFNPIHNIAAAVRYMLARYGHLVGPSSGGYALGGIVDSMSSSQWARGGKVEKPTLMTGEDGRSAPEFVISTNKRFKNANLGYLSQAASALGVPMAREGKGQRYKPKWLGGKGRDAENLQAVQRYTDLQKKEDNQRREISIRESQVKEPETMVKEVGTDPLTGDKLYEVDWGVVNTYKKQMQAVQSAYEKLVQMLETMAQVAQNAENQIAQYMANRQRNIAQLQATVDINRALKKSKDKDAKRGAQNRIHEATRMIQDQQGKIQDAREVRGEIRSDQNDARFRIREDRIALGSVREDIAAVDRTAQSQLADAIESGKAERFEAEPPADPNDARLAQLGAEAALAEIGQGLGGGAPRDMGAIINDQIAVHQARIAGANAMLTDANPANDADAYSTIQDAAGAIGQLNQALQSTPGTAQSMAKDLSTLAVEFDNLTKQFGNNFVLAANMGRMAPFSTAPNAPAFGPSGVQTSTASGGINVYNTFPTPPADPHTWSRNIAFELQAALQ